MSSDPSQAGKPLLKIEDLHISFDTASGPLHAVNGVSLEVERGEILGILGESGSGKSATAKSVMGLLPMPPGRIWQGSVRYKGQELVGMNRKRRRKLMGSNMSWIPQDPLSALNPSFSIGWQVVEAIRTHDDVSRKEARERAAELMESVSLPNPVALLRKYPFELSGGMRQRVLIAMALSTRRPSLLIADEPTTALDVTTQAEIMTLLQRIQADTGIAVILITHDCSLASSVADRIGIMYAGRIVETGTSEQVFGNPGHPYTRGLIQSTPSLSIGSELLPIPGTPPKLMSRPDSCEFAPRCSYRVSRCVEELPPLEISRDDRGVACFEAGAVLSEPSLVKGFLERLNEPDTSLVDRASDREVVVEGRDLVKVFGGGRHGMRRGSDSVRAVDGVSFEVKRGETFCIVGESGSGKSTLARLILGLELPTEGEVLYNGTPIVGPALSMQRRLRRDFQFVAQDPYSNLNPRMNIGDIVSEGWRVHKGIVAPADREKESLALLDRVGIRGADILKRFPGEFSGGQRQRIAIARSLAVRPSILILDEPVSSLDVSVQAQVISLLQDVQRESGLTYIFIAHDLSLVEYIADSIAVMHRGKVVEEGPGSSVLRNPKHAYTQRLKSSAPEWKESGRAEINYQAEPV